MWHARKPLVFAGTVFVLLFFTQYKSNTVEVIRPFCDLRNQISTDKEVILSHGQSQILSKLETKDGKQKSFTIRQPFDSKRLEHGNRVIILSIARDRGSWGNDRSFESYLEMIDKFDYPKELISFGLLISDQEEYESMKEVIEKKMQTARYAAFKLILRIDNTATDRSSRHKDELQKKRRRTLARLRNYLMSSTLEDNDSVLWIDADIISIPSNLLSQMVNSNKDIIAPHCQTPTGEYYDLNTWKGPRKHPNVNEKKLIASGGTFVPGPTKKTKYLNDFTDDFVEIDSVGGTVLFVRGDVHREGVIYPTQYIVGGDWEYEGYDGIETEGICYLAQHLCYKCWGMPNAIVIHDDS